jgi:hypothetical protein
MTLVYNDTASAAHSTICTAATRRHLCYTRNKAEGASFLDQRLPFLPLEAGWSLSPLKEGGEGKAACLTLLLYLLLHPESVFCSSSVRVSAAHALPSLMTAAAFSSLPWPRHPSQARAGSSCCLTGGSGDSPCFAIGQELVSNKQSCPCSPTHAAV